MAKRTRYQRTITAAGVSQHVIVTIAVIPRDDDPMYGSVHVLNHIADDVMQSLKDHTDVSLVDQKVKKS